MFKATLIIEVLEVRGAALRNAAMCMIVRI